MARRRQNTPLRVFLNNSEVALLLKDPSGAISFKYDSSWLAKENAVPVSLSLPLREDPFRGAQVQAVFENLLPDSEHLRRAVAEKVGAQGTDAYSLLSQIGRDCVGALQFMPEGEEIDRRSSALSGEILDKRGIEDLLDNLVKTPLGLDGRTEFRISLAGAQEKTALLRYGGRWMKPHGVTPTSHILKKQMGRLPNGMDLSNSVENEFYCLKLLGAFGLPVNSAEIVRFGAHSVLVVERFDRRWTSPDRVMRLPQEDCCQALSFPPGQKYQTTGGPGMVNILDLLKGADFPWEDQRTFLKAQVLFWLIGATDGHAKNFSILLGPRGRFRMTPLYDVLSAQPSLDQHQISRKDMKLAMSVGDSRHYRLDEVVGRHFLQTAKRARLPETLTAGILREVTESAAKALATVECQLPGDFPAGICASIA
ncbi:MAG: type II toxin-antitoxin system HipA family toxin, partial [Verrucomicrobia bacterium]|nr:type II toxin-antitoxin system HipA family toxin [Verrucomicrobiota bacterium]